MGAMLAATLIVDFHMNWSRVVLIYSGILALWGLFLWVRKSNPSPGYLGALAIAEGVFLVQGISGLIAVITANGAHDRPHDPLHYLYGVVLVLTLPAAYFFGDGGRERRDSLIFGLAALFIIGIAIRGITTGAGPS